MNETLGSISSITKKENKIKELKAEETGNQEAVVNIYCLALLV
jgi:hypothetical protein